ncbi:MAG: glutamate 5-kinase [Spirochaetales bacterium]|jgi:glutamate 5-kinase|nr:glutamate 5-kinase [Spirochaetales bacterium]
MRSFSNVHRVVIKIGTSCLAAGNTIDTAYVRDIAAQTSRVMQLDKRVLIVSSGAIGMGAGELGLTEKVNRIDMRQACAALGQPLLMQEYREAFADYGIKVAQVLLTSDVLANRKSYLNLRNAVETLLGLGVVPIFNENDSVSTDEIGSAFGDNDTLSAYMASKINADLLIMLSDINSLYTSDPRKDRAAKPIRTVEKITQEIQDSAGAAGSTFAVGGMATKIEAAKIAGKAGCSMVIASGREDRIIDRIISGEEIGTLFIAESRMSARERWILNSRPAGSVVVDDGALKAIRGRKSLLPSGLVSIDGFFNEGDVILVNGVVKLVSAFNSSELESILGRHSSEIRTILGDGRKEVVARPEDMVFLDQE